MEVDINIFFFHEPVYRGILLRIQETSLPMLSPHKRQSKCLRIDSGKHTAILHECDYPAYSWYVFLMEMICAIMLFELNPLFFITLQHSSIV